MRRVMMIAIAAVVAVVAVVAVLLLTLDVNRYKDIIQARVEAATGRRLSLDGKLSLKLGLTPSIVVHGARFANAAWGSAPDMVSVARVEVAIRLWPALFRDIQVTRLVLIEPKILLETNGQGLGNWVIEPPPNHQQREEVAQLSESVPSVATASDLAPLALFVSSARIVNGDVVYHDGRTGQTMRSHVGKLVASATDPTKPLTVALVGVVEDVPYDISGAIGSLSALLANKPLSLRLNGTFGGVAASIDGVIKQPRAMYGIDLRATVDADDLTGLKPLFAIPHLPSPLAFRGRVMGDKAAVNVEDMTLRLGRTQASGSVAVAFGGARPQVTAKLRAPLVDVREWVPPPSSPTRQQEAPVVPSAASSTPPTALRSGRVFAATPLSLGGLRALDATFDVQVDKLIAPREVTVGAITVHGVLDDGHLIVDPAAATWGGGTVSAALDLNAADASVKTDIAVDGLMLDQVVSHPDVRAAVAGGRTNATVALTGHGVSLASIMGSLNGSIVVKVGSARVNNVLLDHIKSNAWHQIVDLIVPQAAKQSYTVLSCAVANVRADQGVLAWRRQIAVETAQASVVSSGGVNLGTETVDASLHLHPKRSRSRFEEALQFVRLRGTLADPRLVVDSKSMRSGVLSVLKGFIGNDKRFPAAKNKSRDPHPCATALRSAP